MEYIREQGIRPETNKELVSIRCLEPYAELLKKNPDEVIRSIRQRMMEIKRRFPQLADEIALKDAVLGGDSRYFQKKYGRPSLSRQARIKAKEVHSLAAADIAHHAP